MSLANTVRLILFQVVSTFTRRIPRVYGHFNIMNIGTRNVFQCGCLATSITIHDHNHVYPYRLLPPKDLKEDNTYNTPMYYNL